MDSGRFDFRGMRRARRDDAANLRADARRAAIATRYADLLDLMRRSAVAFRLMGTGDYLTPLIERHVAAGCGLPLDVEETIRLRAAEGCTERLDQDSLRWFLVSLLRAAVCVLPRRDRAFAWDLVESWGRDGALTLSQWEWVATMLARAHEAGRGPEAPAGVR